MSTFSFFRPWSVHEIHKLNPKRGSLLVLNIMMASLLLMLCCAAAVEGFYLPGSGPKDYSEGDSVILKVVKLTSVKTQLPYEYYTLPFCSPVIDTQRENLGEILVGDRIMNSLYELEMLKNKPCAKVCRNANENPKKYNAEQVNLFRSRIKDQYRVHWLLDDLPAATVISKPNEDLKYAQGFPVGLYDETRDHVYLYNHINIVAKYNLDKVSQKYRVVAFETYVESINTASYSFAEDGVCSKVDKAMLELKEDTPTDVYWTYSVSWKESEISWSTRWETYLAMSDSVVHWFSILNSLFIVIFLSIIVGLIMVRTLSRDIARYNDIEFQDDAVEETGWKLVHGDVFRPPLHATLLCASIGSGIQILSMLFIVLSLALFGMLSPAASGSLVTYGLGIFVFMGVFAGYFSSRLYKTLKGQHWKTLSLTTAVLYPGIIFGLYFFLNFFVWGKHSSSAIPLGSLFYLLLLWFGISTPLVFLGSYFGYRKAPYDHGVRTNQIPRQIPDHPWYMNLVVSTILTGILPFGSVFLELFFVFVAIWENKYYYLFGILFLVFAILILTCSLNTIVSIYFFLCSEDYHWWWRSFILSSGTSFYVLLYSIFFYYNELDITNMVSNMLYFGYTLIIVATFFFLTGTIGFYASYWFISKIYRSVKID